MHIPQAKSCAQTRSRHFLTSLWLVSAAETFCSLARWLAPFSGHLSSAANSTNEARRSTKMATSEFQTFDSLISVVTASCCVAYALKSALLFARLWGLAAVSDCQLSSSICCVSCPQHHHLVASSSTRQLALNRSRIDWN